MDSKYLDQWGRSGAVVESKERGWGRESSAESIDEVAAGGNGEISCEKEDAECACAGE